jgi:hypothetical protein
VHWGPCSTSLRNRIPSPMTSSQLLISCSLGFHFSSPLSFFFHPLHSPPFLHPPLSAERIVTDLLEQDDEANLVHCTSHLRGGNMQEQPGQRTRKLPVDKEFLLKWVALRPPWSLRRIHSLFALLRRNNKSRFPFPSVGRNAIVIFFKV